jgi:hypothetical protein
MMILEDGELAARMKEGVYCHAHRRGSFVDEKDGQKPEEDEMIKMQYKKTLRRISSLSTFFVEDKIDPNLRVFSDGSSSQTESHQTLEGKKRKCYAFMFQLAMNWLLLVCGFPT